MQTEFETLCQLLREENFQELDQYNEQVFKKKYGSTAIIEILAYENNKVAVEYILSKSDMISLAAQGAARGLHKEFVNDLFNRGANIDLIVQGAALGGHKDYVDELLKRGADIVYAASGAGFGGHRDLINHLKRNYDSLNVAALGAALGNHINILEDLLNKKANINDAIHGASQSGNKELIEKLLSRGAKIDDAVFGAALGGHMTLIDDLLTEGAAIDKAIEGASKGGHSDISDKLQIIKSIMAKEQVSYKAYLLTQNHDITPNAAKAYLKGANWTQILFQLNSENLAASKNINKNVKDVFSTREIQENISSYVYGIQNNEVPKIKHTFFERTNICSEESTESKELALKF